MVTMVQGGSDGARLRAAVDRLHVAQLAALATPEACHSVGPDAYSAERRLLEHVAEMGSLLARLGRAGVEGAGGVELPEGRGSQGGSGRGRRHSGGGGAGGAARRKAAERRGGLAWLGESRGAGEGA